nr:DegT/DnrJ/EryC1/StrS family aminotransferase [Candidatus Omnitrophota bacterium]
ANAVLRVGATPVFVDIKEEDFNIDHNKIKVAINKKTKAIIVVHYAGAACDMDNIMRLAKKHRLFVVEDAAHAIGAKYHRKYLGTIGTAGCFSFHQTKNITCGEGGAFVCSQKRVFHKAEIIREKGTDRSAFLRAEINRYTWRNCGGSLVMSELLSAMAGEQFKKLNQINNKRRSNADYLLKGLRCLEKQGRLKLPQSSKSCQSSWHIFAIRVPSSRRDWLISALRAEGIETSSHFVPLHSAPYARRALKIDYALPITEKISREIIRLPVYPQLKKSDMDDIITVFNKILHIHKK